MFRKLLLVLLPLLVLSSCNFKVKETPNWDTNVLAPLLKSRVTLKDAIKDSSFIRTNSDNSLTLVYRDTLINLVLADYITVPDTEVAVTVTLDSISLTTDTLSEGMTIYEMGTEMLADSDPTNDIFGGLIVNDGQPCFNAPFFGIPAATVASGQVVAIDASDYFQTADLLEGEIYIEIRNHLSIGIDSIEFTLANAGQAPFLTKIITNILPGQTKADSADLAGQQIENQMEAEIVNIKTMAVAGGTPICDADSIEIVVILRDLKAASATAIFPSQTVIDDNTNVRYFFGDGVELTRMTVESGELKVTAKSTINDTLRFSYELPSALKDGRPVLVESTMLPAPIGDTIVNDTIFDLANAYIDLTLNGDSVNLFPQHLIGKLVYSGNMVSMDLADLIYVYYGLLSIRPSYAEGYLGKDTFDFADNLPFDYFNSINSGQLDLSDPKVSFTFENSIGVDGELVINNLTAYNRREGTNVSLNAPIVNSPVAIPGPRLPNVGETISSRFEINKNNSNIRDFVSLLPDSLAFDMRVYANKNGVPALHNNFATNKSKMVALMDMEVPLDGIADNIGLGDTLGLNLTGASVPENVKDGTLRLYLENSFPFEAKVQIYFYNDNMVMVDSLFEAGPGVIAAGAVDGNGFVAEPTIVSIESWFDQARLQNLQTNATQAIARFKLSTRPTGQAVKIYSTYGIVFRLVGDFNYKVGM